MRMTSTGLIRKKLTKEGTSVRYFADKDSTKIRRSPNQEFGDIRVEIRSEKRYLLFLKADEVISCLLTLDPELIREAIGRMGFDIAKQIPELLMNLAKSLVPEEPVEPG